MIDGTIYTLALDDDPTLSDYMLKRFAMLDPAQTSVVRRFLEWASLNESHCDAVVARGALKRRWLR